MSVSRHSWQLASAGQCQGVEMTQACRLPWLSDRRGHSDGVCHLQVDWCVGQYGHARLTPSGEKNDGLP